MLTPAQRDDFARDGFLRLGRMLDEERLAALCRRADELAAGTVVNENVRVAPGAVEGLEADEVFWPLVSHPLLLAACARAYGAHAAVSVVRAAVTDEPAATSWHQDGGDDWELDRDPLITAWVALEADGQLELVPGSHRLGLVARPEEDAGRSALAQRLELEAGDAVVLHNWLIRRSTGPHRAMTYRYADGRTISTRTGERFPVIHGELPEEPYHFLAEIRRDRVALRASFAECEAYALSLAAEVERLRDEPQRGPLGGLRRRARELVRR